MKEYVEAIILGIVQGLTEFLPVSSSGHLELAKWLLGDTDTAEESFIMTVVLHFGTALATVWVFRKEILRILRSLGNRDGQQFVRWIVISMIPAGLVGLLLEAPISRLFDRQIILVAICLLITGVTMVISDRLKPADRPLTNIRALLIGIAQAVAIMPGISRSGSTIFTALLTGLHRREAAQFSFLMVLPLIFGKMLKDAFDADVSYQPEKTLPLLIGFGVSFGVGVFACRWMISIVRNARLRYFGYYCITIGIAAILFKSFS